MPFRIEHSDGFVLVTLSGALTAEDLRAVSAQLAALEDSLPECPPRLTDLRTVEGVGVSFTDVLDLAAARRARSFPNSFRSALVVAREVQKGYARMFQTLNDHPMVQIRIFDDRESAEAWLRQPITER
jgi:hypothetical protein